MTLALNAGSSSIKFASFDEHGATVLRGGIARLGLPDAAVAATSANGVPIAVPPMNSVAPGDQPRRLVEWLAALPLVHPITAIGHRIVHGGLSRRLHQAATPDLLAELRRAIPLDPAHLPREIELVEICQRAFPGVPQVLCFDTVFHNDMPEPATRLPIPRDLHAAGVRRYGFHGLSYEFLMEELVRAGDPAATGGRVILAHLGSGASMAAVVHGRPIDTTMAFTPAGGLVMGRRPGDIDPGVLVHLLRSRGLDADGLDVLLSTQCGLQAISESTGDMQVLLAQREDNPRAAEAVAAFCTSARKWIGALAAALGGLDTLVFSGGIGERAPAVRAEICKGLDFLDIRLDPQRNSASAPVISSGDATAVVRVIPTDEESVIASHCRRILAAGPAGRKERT